MRQTLLRLVAILLLGMPVAMAQLDAPNYRGEIRRDANGQLVAVPIKPGAPDAEPAAPALTKPKTKPGRLESNHIETSVSTARQSVASSGKTLRVGPQQALRSIAAAAKLAADGDTIEIEAGDYRADVAVWEQANLTIRGIGPGRPRLIAAGAHAEGKGIWIVRGGAITVENLEFRDAHVHDRNGAGIRFEKGYLTVRNCKFENNENGILTAGGPDMFLDIEDSEFAHNGVGDGRTHNLYVGQITRLRVSGSYFHHARIGHLLKSRAEENHIFYNRLSDQIDGAASYELEFPNGGVAYVVGNLIAQNSQTDNPTLISFGAEGYKGANVELYLVNNTLVDDRPVNGKLLVVKPGIQRLVAVNNILVSAKQIEPEVTGVKGGVTNNPNADWDQFILPQRFDYRLKPNARLLGKYVAPAPANGFSLVPQREYVHPASSRPLAVSTRHPGAFQTPGPASR
jgi:hypothetical protein